MYRQHILFIFLFLLATIVNSYKLIGRAFHTSNYINDKIYFLGGGIETTEYTNDFFYLNVSVPFTLDSLPIFNVSSNVQIAKHGRATSTVCGHNKDTIFLFGGDFDDDESALPLVFAFNISIPQWTNANVRGLEPIRRRWSSSACDKQKMYIFAGYNSHQSTFRNDFDILDINRLTWSLGSKVNIPNPRDVATATILSDGKIVFLGGNGDGNIINMSEINLYDTNNDKWSQMVTNGTPPAGRMGHTTVLTKDGRIIVYGGQTFDGPLAHHDQLSVLDTTEQIFRWSIPEIKYTPISAPY
ncbi:2663_t:CDS:2, partial [Funneliformis mosseae]